MKIKMKALRQHGGGMEVDEDLGMALEGTFMQDEVQIEEGDMQTLTRVCTLECEMLQVSYGHSNETGSGLDSEERADVFTMLIIRMITLG